ncbi:MAG: hypothetical protein Q4B04_04690 [bacterium]|nr:hypothetical protein [bacterium]
MDDMSAKISALLSDPEGMEKIKDMAGKLFGETAQPDFKKPQEPQQDLAGLPNIDMGTIMSIMSAMKTEDSRSQLLLALKPHLSDTRKERVDNAIKIMKLVNILPVLKDNDIFNLF